MMGKKERKMCEPREWWKQIHRSVMGRREEMRTDTGKYCIAIEKEKSRTDGELRQRDTATCP